MRGRSRNGWCICIGFVLVSFIYISNRVKEKKAAKAHRRSEEEENDEVSSLKQKRHPRKINTWTRTTDSLYIKISSSCKTLIQYRLLLRKNKQLNLRKVRERWRHCKTNTNNSFYWFSLLSEAILRLLQYQQSILRVSESESERECECDSMTWRKEELCPCLLHFSFVCDNPALLSS